MSNIVNQFGDTTLTKVFVGGLAWETPKEALREHFDTYGEILEAVIISDKVTGRSKGYGFVTFKDPEAAKKACEEAAPIINGRRANCNLASLGARRPRSVSNPPTPPPQLQGSNGPTRSTTPAAPASHVQWYYPAPPLSSGYHHQQQHHRQSAPFYGYSPAYNYGGMRYHHGGQKVGYTTTNGHYSQMYPGGQAAMVGGNPWMPMYPLYQYHTAVGLPSSAHHHYFPPTTVNSVPAAILSKPTPMVPSSGTIGCS